MPAGGRPTSQAGRGPTCCPLARPAISAAGRRQTRGHGHGRGASRYDAISTAGDLSGPELLMAVPGVGCRRLNDRRAQPQGRVRLLTAHEVGPDGRPCGRVMALKAGRCRPGEWEDAMAARTRRALASGVVATVVGLCGAAAAHADTFVVPYKQSAVPSSTRADIDTGLDYRHPDLRQNVDGADSVNCLSGAPVPGAAAANDDNGHGTHTAGTIAAAANGIGIVGVAPNVRIAGIKAGNAAGFFFPEAVVCAFVWAGTHGFNVTNNSYFADPFYLNCHNDPVQRAIWKAESRAIRFAMSQGVTVVAAVGNFADDLAH